MKRVMAGLAAGAVWLMAAMPASAQLTSIDDLSEEQMGELYCVYDYLDFFGDRSALTSAYMAGDPDAAAYKQEMEELDAATSDCKDEYKWDDGRTDTASMIGLFGVMGDEIEDRLKAAGLSETDLGTTYDVIDAMSDDDIKVFVDGAWMGKDDVAHRLIAALEVKGLKGDAVKANALYLAEAYIIVSLLTADWLQQTPKAS